MLPLPLPLRAFRHALTGALFLCALLFPSAPPASAAPGDLDLSFGDGGKVLTSIGEIPQISRLFYNVPSPIILNDGKLLLQDSVVNGGDWDFALMRLNADGSPDGTFGRNGRTTVDFGPGSQDSALRFALLSDGKILSAGSTWSENARGDLALACFDPDGSPHNGFGREGLLLIDVFEDSNDYLVDMEVQSDGKIILAGLSFHDLMNRYILMRCDQNGIPDPAFGVNGVVEVTGISAFMTDILVQPDGKIVVAGSVYTYGAQEAAFALLRFNPDGSADTGFGRKGRALTSFEDRLVSEAYAVALQPDGSLVSAGVCHDPYSWAAPRPSLFALTRHLADGTPDEGFGVSGKTVTGVGGAFTVAVQRDGRILVAGDSWNGKSTELALIRCNWNGELDDSFGSGGKVSTDIDAFGDGIASLAMLPDGAILAAGTSEGPPGWTNPRHLLVRYRNTMAPLPRVTTLSPEGSKVSATLHAVVNAGETGGEGDGGGSAVYFEYSADGGVSYSRIAATPAAVTGNTDVPVSAFLNNLPAGYVCRARAVAVSGVTGAVFRGEEISFTAPGAPSAQRLWRQTHFGSAESVGDGADSADPDRDGFSNLMEWTAGSDPKAASPPFFEAAHVWEPEDIGHTQWPHLEFTYSRSTLAFASGARLSMEWADDPALGPWTSEEVRERVVSNDGATHRMRALVPAPWTGRRFVRLRVTAP